MRLLFVLALATSACASLKPTVWELPTGEKVECVAFRHSDCGLDLAGCGADQSVEFDCLPRAVFHGVGTPGGYAQ